MTTNNITVAQLTANEGRYDKKKYDAINQLRYAADFAGDGDGKTSDKEAKNIISGAQSLATELSEIVSGELEVEESFYAIISSLVKDKTVKAATLDMELDKQEIADFFLMRQARYKSMANFYAGIIMTDDIKALLRKSDGFGKISDENRK